MDHINNLIGKAVNKTALPTTTQNGPTNFSAQSRQQSIDLINKVFKSLKAIFPAWAVAIKDPEIESQARQEWLKGLVENGINSDTQINSGLAKCRAHNSPFLPSIGQFVTWCKESTGLMSGIPSETEARLAMIRELGKSPDIRSWNQCHPAVYWVYCQRTSFDWKQMSNKDLNDLFHDFWQIALKMAKDNVGFDAPIPRSHRIESSIESPAPKEVAIAEVSKLMSMFEDEPQPKPLTQAEQDDLARLERLK